MIRTEVNLNKIFTILYMPLSLGFYKNIQYIGLYNNESIICLYNIVNHEIALSLSAIMGVVDVAHGHPFSMSEVPLVVVPADLHWARGCSILHLGLDDVEVSS